MEIGGRHYEVKASRKECEGFYLHFPIRVFISWRLRSDCHLKFITRLAFILETVFSAVQKISFEMLFRRNSCLKLSMPLRLFEATSQSSRRPVLSSAPLWDTCTFILRGEKSSGPSGTEASIPRVSLTGGFNYSVKVTRVKLLPLRGPYVMCCG